MAAPSTTAASRKTAANQETCFSASPPRPGGIPVQSLCLIPSSPSSRRPATTDGGDVFVSRKKTNSPSDVRKGRPKGDDVNSGGLTLDSCFSVNNTVMFFLRSWVRRSSYRNVLSSFVGQKKQLLESIGFGGLLSMHKQPRISHCLAFWLLRNMDNASSSIVTRDGVKIHVKDADANLVLGLPHKLVKITLGLGKHANIRMECIEYLLLKDYCGKMSTKKKCNPGSQLVCLSAYVVRVAKEASVKVKHALSSGKKSVSLDLLAISRGLLNIVAVSQ
ncbi:hypothetical protein EJB05_44702 [Eragrostis curvula]|uniref:Uncharacterized protein n=1 Tax=Eragrostis curvula TaxID=38414 RepID=A0A5J9TI91_9POAL|nr:hypothetical protein EJB05_44702 [Eragrostis curvula]